MKKTDAEWLDELLSRQEEKRLEKSEAKDLIIAGSIIANTMKDVLKEKIKEDIMKGE